MFNQVSVSIGTHCHGLCSVTFFPKNNQRTAPTESPMMAALPLFSATVTTGHPHWTYIRAPSEYFLHSDTSDAKVRFRTDARTENRKNRTVGSGSVQFGPQILGCQFGSQFYDFLNFENWVRTGSNRTFCTYFFLIFLL